MGASQVYILIFIVVLAIIAFLAFFLGKKKQKPLTPLAGLAFGFIIAGIIFGENRLIGYGLMGIGVMIAVADSLIKLKKN